MKAAGKAFTLAASILQASVARRLACLKQPCHHTGLLQRAQRGSLLQRCGRFLDQSKTASGLAISEKCSIEPPPHFFQELTFPFQRLSFPSTRGNISRFLRISTMITVP